MYTMSTKIIDCLAKGVRILHSMKSSSLFAPVPLDTWKSEI